jgi:hypothetical protein
MSYISEILKQWKEEIHFEGVIQFKYSHFT